MLGIIASVADLRSEPKFRSERVSQLIYGERVSVVEEGEEYSLIEGPDKVRGYVKNTQIGELSERKYVLKSHFTGKFNLSAGSYLGEDDAEKFGVPSSFLANINERFEPTKIAHNFLGVPYLWGGTSDFGFDCSGFTQRLFRLAGIEIPRNSEWQKDAARPVPDLQSAKEGDVLFFEGHVALYIGNGKIIHANGYYMAVTYTDLYDGSSYSNFLLKSLKKVGRFE